MERKVRKLLCLHSTALLFIDTKSMEKPLKTSSGPELIEIPLTEVFLNRAHAIMKALNARFSKGVVFDFNESQKRMTITRQKYDKYTIEMQDITLSSIGLAPFQPVYTYSTSGMFCAASSPRKGLPGNHRPFVMICREIREYNETFYESLQNRLAPVGKDDDYKEYRSDWERLYKAKWQLTENALINQWKMVRFIKNYNHIPGTWSNYTKSMLNDLYEKVVEWVAIQNQMTPTKMPGVVVQLDGDWVTV